VLPRDRTTQQKIQEYRKFYENRDRFIIIYATLLNRLFAKETERPKLVRISGLVVQKDGHTISPEVLVTFRGTKGVSYGCNVEDGILWQGKWYFRTKPKDSIIYIRGDKKAPEPIEELATDDEKKQIAALKKEKLSVE
jgi:hypothetical protein